MLGGESKVDACALSRSSTAERYDEEHVDTILQLTESVRRTVREDEDINQDCRSVEDVESQFVSAAVVVDDHVNEEKMVPPSSVASKEPKDRQQEQEPSSSDNISEKGIEENDESMEAASRSSTSAPPPGAYAISQQRTTFLSIGSLTVTDHTSSSFHEHDQHDEDQHHEGSAELSLVVAAEVSSHVNAVEVKPEEDKLRKRMKSLVFVIGLATIFIAVVLGTATRNNGSGNSERAGIDEDIYATSASSASPSLAPSPSPTEMRIPTLDKIKAKGKLTCSTWWGLEDVLCAAIAAAIFGRTGNITDYIEHPKVEDASFNERWERENELDGFLSMYNETYDVITILQGHNMEQDVLGNNDGMGYGVTFSDPFRFSSIGVGGIPKYVNCAENVNLHLLPEECAGTAICYRSETNEEKIAERVYPANVLRGVNSVFESFVAGECNVMMGDIAAHGPYLKHLGYDGEYEAGTKTFSVSPLSAVTSDKDPQFSDFVNWILRALIMAEEMNITKENATMFPTTDVFGEEYQNMFVNAITIAGNYGDIYYNHFEQWDIQRLPLNQLNDGNSGLIMSRPFGNVMNSPHSTPIEGRFGFGHKSSLLEQVLERGYLLCGVQGRRPGFATYNDTTNQWYGLDVDFCHSLAGAIFITSETNDEILNGTTTTGTNNDSIQNHHLQIVDLAKGSEYQSLDWELIDVLAGGKISLETDVHEPTTGKGYTFTQPYYYYYFDDSNGEQYSIGMATREHDPYWSKFVYWVVASTFHAESIACTQAIPSLMPLVSTFGETFQYMFRGAITATGNYGEMYSRNLQQQLLPPRNGRNLLNRNPYGPQHYPANQF